MGVLTDFVVADRRDAQRVGESTVPSQEFGGIDAKGMDQVKMGTLYAILTQTDFDPEFLVNEESFLYAASDDGPWVQLVPQDMVARLTELSGDDIPKITEEWRTTEEFDPRYCDWVAEDIERFVQEIAAISRKAIAENKSVLMWTSL